MVCFFLNTGYALNRSIFATLRRHEDMFWAFSEGWDYSLFHLMQMRVLPRQQVVGFRLFFSGFFFP